MSFSKRYSSVKFYSSRKYSSNPFFQKKRKKIRRVSLKFKLLVFLAVALVAGIGWLLFFNRYFFIDNIIINGSKNIAEGKIYEIIEGRLQTRRLLFLPQKNIFVFSKRQAKKEILKNFFVADLKINKKLPRTLKISFNENTPVAVWAEGDAYYYIDNNLVVLSPVDNLELTGQLLIFKNVSVNMEIKTEGLTKKVGVGEKYAQACLNLTSKLKAAGLDAESICEINKPDGEVRFNLKAGGTKLRFNVDEDIEKQLEKLKVLLSEKISKDQLTKLEYIDLRFGDKVYYK